MASQAFGWRATGLAAGGWTQTYAQVDTEAGMHGFDRDYFVQQVAGLAQLAGEFMVVKPLVIDLGWGTLKSALVKLPDTGYVEPHAAKQQRQILVNQYVAAFRRVESGTLGEARAALSSLSAKISASVVNEQLGSIQALVDHQLAKLA
jgi:hypothetical protein